MSRLIDTIIACCTPQGSGALALIRLSGPEAYSIAERFCRIRTPGISQAPTHTIHYGTIHDGQAVIDDVLFLVMRAPQTFTGEDTLEITCHNNPFIIQAIIKLACTYGARPAGPGEFTQQAVFNQKLDLIQAEAIHDLIAAPSEQALKASRSQLRGSLSAELNAIEQQMLYALALCNASFEFIEEEGIEFGTSIRDILSAIDDKIAELLRQYPTQKTIREGIRVALIGSVNAGKSSLFNQLIEQDRAIVTPIAGTTRDVIEFSSPYKGSYITFIDTAGIRKTDDVIEQTGIERSFQQAAQADIVLLIIDQSRTLSADEAQFYQQLFDQYHDKLIVVYSKNDLLQVLENFLENSRSIKVSQSDIQSIAKLKSLVHELAHSQFSAHDSPYLLNKRHMELLESIHTKIRATLEATIHGFAYEIVALELTDMLSQLSQVTGKTVSEQSMDKIFKEFCIGK